MYGYGSITPTLNGEGEKMTSQIFQLPSVMASLKARGYHLQVGLEQLKIEITRITGITKDMTLANTVRYMCTLGYLRDSGNGNVFYISQKGLYDFPQAKKKIEEDAIEEIDAKLGV
jgi:hypothetical protein